MRILLYIVLVVCLIFSMTACTQSAPESPGESSGPVTESPAETATPASDAPSPSEAPQESSDPASTPSDIPEASDEPADEPTETYSFDVYSLFLQENYTRIAELCYGGIAGVGFIDLDLDDDVELLLFDSGASASMGVQFFDIADDGSVVCVSANMLDLGHEFGGENLSTVYVNANYFDDFRLMHMEDGTSGFFVTSGNSALDFSYSELISFSSADGVLSLSSLLYRYDDFDIESGEIVTTHCSYLGESVQTDEYETQLAQFNSSWTDTGYEAFGVFIWESRNYTADYDGFMAMVDAAIAGYVPLPES